MVEIMIVSTSSSNNMHRVVDDNSNPYRNMVIDAMIIKSGSDSQCLIVDKELNAEATRFF